MKKILYSFLAFLALSIALPLSANAATFSFSPSTGSFIPGETFSVAVYVNPGAGEEITTAQLSSMFSANGLEVVSFSPADGWMPLVAPGSDLIDNNTGKLVKTGGFPARVTASKQFGVITLKAKNAGTATISIEGDSMLLDSTNTNKYVASAGASFTIAEPAPTPTPTPPPATTPTTDTSGGVSGTVATDTTTPATESSEEESVLELEEEEAATTPEPTTASQPIAPQPLLATVGSVVTFGTNSVFVGILAVVAILALIGYAVYTVIQRVRRKNLGKGQ